jgi:hypothetical protein
MAVSEERTRNRNIIHGKTHELVRKVIQSSDENTSKKEMIFPVSHANKRAAEYCRKAKHCLRSGNHLIDFYEIQ